MCHFFIYICIVKFHHHERRTQNAERRTHIGLSIQWNLCAAKFVWEVLSFIR